jgi:hypothetical protein
VIGDRGESPDLFCTSFCTLSGRIVLIERFVIHGKPVS